MAMCARVRESGAEIVYRREMRNPGNWISLAIVTMTSMFGGCASADRHFVDTRSASAMAGEVRVVASQSASLVVVERLSIRIDDRAVLDLGADGRAQTIRLAPGLHAVEVIGAFQLADPQRTALTRQGAGDCIVERCGGAWHHWRRRALSFELREQCSGTMHIDVYDLPTPSQWPVEAPMLDVDIQTRCDRARGT